MRHAGDDGADYWLGLAHDVTEDRDREQRRYEAAYYDDLTGLPNRALAQARIEVVLERLKPAAPLVRDVHLDPTRRDLASRLVSLAGEHGLATAAVAVETEGEAEYLEGVGCAAAQGHRFGRPEII